jgi:hypothetical protein
MSTSTDTAPTVTGSDHADDLVHLWCCDDTIAYCGLDITEDTPLDDWADEDECVVCGDLEQSGALCPKCGEPFNGVRP